MIALAASQLFLRSKFKRALLANFDLMIIVVTNKLFIRLKFANNAFLNLPQSGDQIIIRNFDLMKTGKII